MLKLLNFNKVKCLKQKATFKADYISNGEEKDNLKNDSSK